MIDGLRLTITGEELRERLAERVQDHRRRAEWYNDEKTREPDPNDEYACQLPEHMCEYEEEFHTWRAAVLAYIREHIEGGEVYRLSAADLAFGEILPVQPGMVAQVEYERVERVGHSLERIAKEMGRSPFGSGAMLEALIRQRARPRNDSRGAIRKKKTRADATASR